MTPAVPDPTVEALAVRFETEVRQHGAPQAMNPQAAAGWDLGMARAAFIVRTEGERILAEHTERAVREALEAAAVDAVPRFNVHPLNRSNVVADWLRDRAQHGGRP